MKKPTIKQEIGKIGEDIAVRFLVKHKYVVIQRNYLKKVGEIDIICKKDNKLYFVEVKTVSRENISRETYDNYRAEDNIHSAKISRISRVIPIFLEENNLDLDWELIAVIVTIDKTSKVAKVKLLNNFAW